MTGCGVTHPSTPWPLRFVLLAAAWGSTFLFIKIGDEALSPLQRPSGAGAESLQRSTKYAPLPCPLENHRLVTVFLRV